MQSKKPLRRYCPTCGKVSDARDFTYQEKAYAGRMRTCPRCGAQKPTSKFTVIKTASAKQKNK